MSNILKLLQLYYYSIIYYADILKERKKSHVQFAHLNLPVLIYTVMQWQSKKLGMNGIVNKMEDSRLSIRPKFSDRKDIFTTPIHIQLTN